MAEKDNDNEKLLSTTSGDTKNEGENHPGIIDNKLEDEPKAKILKLDSSLHLPINIKSRLTNNDFIEKFQKQWVNQLEYNDLKSDVKLYAEPFRLCVMKRFLSDKDITKNLVTEMNEIEWSRKQMDLYEFYQSPDLSNATAPYLSAFFHMLQTQAMPLLEKLCGIKLKYVSASCSMYNCGDYLLVHDDLLKDRQIAFIFYLSPWKDFEEWTEQMGGCLEIFNTDANCFPLFPVEKKILPANNQFAFFKVGSKSFHQVGEVTNFDYPRLTINGWFHGDSNNDLSSTLRPLVSSKFKEAVASPFDLSEFINIVYLTEKSKNRIQKHIEDNSEICLQEFLLPNVFDNITKQLMSDTNLIWRLKGPANAHSYEVLDIDNIDGHLKTFVDLLSSKTLFSLLHQYTDLDLSGKFAKNPCLTLEVQKWLHGSYTLLADGSSWNESSLDVVFYFNSTENVGVITYLSPVDDESESMADAESECDDDSVLLTITPKDNALSIVYRCAGTTKFTKYISKNTPLTNGPVYIVIGSYKE